MGELKHVTGSYTGRPVGQYRHILAYYEAVSTQNHLSLRIPHYQLPAWRIHQVKLIDVTLFSGTATGVTERDLTQSTYLTHHIGRCVGIDYIYQVAALVGFPQELVMSQFTLQYIG